MAFKYIEVATNSANEVDNINFLTFDGWVNNNNEDTTILALYPECAGKDLRTVLSESYTTLTEQAGFVSYHRDNVPTGSTKTVTWESEAAYKAHRAANLENTTHGSPVLLNGVQQVNADGVPVFHSPVRHILDCYYKQFNVSVVETTETI